VGLTFSADIFEPETSSSQDAMMTGLVDDVFNEVVPRAVKTGRARIFFPGFVDIDEAVPGLQGTFDYLGINYYTRRYVRFDLSQDTLSRQYFMPGRAASDLGYEVYPEGLYRMLKREARWGWPIIIMENGIADETGERRADYLRSHLYAVTRAMQEGVDVRGYFHWSLTDNFEWSSGYYGRLGLFRVVVTDPDLVRQPTSAVKEFRRIAEEAGLAPH
jgi:beta-glucosidase